MNLGLVDGLNKIAINVWAVGLIAIGAALALHSHADMGSTLITGGFALLRSGDKSEVKPSTDPNKV